jgi:hypothetical protein
MGVCHWGLPRGFVTGVCHGGLPQGFPLGVCQSFRGGVVEFFCEMKLFHDRLNWKKWPHPRVLRPPDGA